MDRLDRISPAKLDKTLGQWPLPLIPSELGVHLETQPGRTLDLKELSNRVKKELGQTQDNLQKARFELTVMDWLYTFIRANIKRGRVFELEPVLSERCADCLGYVKIFKMLGRRLALDIGAVDVVIDNAGRYIPHIVNILKLADKRIYFIDPWYGSKNINHQRVGLQVKEGSDWVIRDVNRHELESLTDVRGLPQQCLDATTYYMMANRHLEKGLRCSDDNELGKAIVRYDAAIALYPENARFYFNRAIAHENRGNMELAQNDYTRAMRDEPSQIRVMARQYEEVTQLMGLDQMQVSSRDQEIYLLYKRFVTGQEVSPKDIAAKYQVSTEEVERITSQIEQRLPIVIQNM